MSKPYAVLLRGINLGKARRIAMADLRTALKEAGFADVRTLLASGNVVLSSSLSETELATAAEELLCNRFGARIPVLVRTREELAAIAKLNPLSAAVTNPSRSFVTFYDTPVPATVLSVLDDVETEGDKLKAVDRELYAWYPEGSSKSAASEALTKQAAKKPTARITSRNWNTVLKVLAALEEVEKEHLQGLGGSAGAPVL